MNTQTVMELKGALLAKGYTVAKIAREMGITHVSVSRVIHGHQRSERVQDFIRSVLGRDPFPQRKRVGAQTHEEK